MAIADRSRLAELLGDILTRLGPSTNAVAKEYGVRQSQLSRLLTKQRGRVAPQTYNELLWLAVCAAAPSEGLRRHIRNLRDLFLRDAEGAALGTDWLESCKVQEIRHLFLGAKAQAALAAYRDWIDRLHGTREVQLGVTLAQRKRLNEAAQREPLNEAVCKLLVDAAVRERLNAAAIRKRLVDAVHKSKVERELDKLYRVCTKRGHDPSRLLAAFVSVLEPLNRYTTTLGIERGFDELSDKELTDFVALGLRREQILLNRDNERARAQQAARSQRRIMKALTNHRMSTPAQSFVMLVPIGARDTKDNTPGTSGNPSGE